MKQLAIMGSGRLGHYSVNPVRYGGSPGGWLKSPRFLHTAIGWLNRRRQRRALERLDDRMLKDIGVTRLDAKLEIEKPFWRG